MRLKNLKDCWIYSAVSIKIDGETAKKWRYKGYKKLNIQQDIDELDRTPAGIIDYDKLKIRTDYDIDLKKNDGISLIKLEIDENGYTLEPPKYEVIASPKVGKTTNYTCQIYHGE